MKQDAVYIRWLADHMMRISRPEDPAIAFCNTNVTSSPVLLQFCNNRPIHVTKL